MAEHGLYHASKDKTRQHTDMFHHTSLATVILKCHNLDVKNNLMQGTTLGQALFVDQKFNLEFCLSRNQMPQLIH